jgi:hypothetical protein
MDIIYIGSLASGYSCDWNTFADIANKEYASGYGGQEVIDDLVIVFSDRSRLERGEYDGSEWWNFVDITKLPDNRKQLTKLFKENYESNLFELHNQEE